MKYYDLTINGSEVQRRLDLANHNVLGFDGILDVPVTASDELITSAESYQIVYAPNGGRGEMLMYVNGAYYRNFRLQSSGKTYLDSSWYNEDGQIRKDRLFLNGAARDIYAYAAGSFGKVERDGTDGITPHIDPTTKHWMIDDEDTGIVAEGQDGQDGTDGIDGTDGKSAFDIWLENGHTGNISDFLAWMKDTSSMLGPKFAATTADCVMVNDTPTMYYVPDGTTFNVYLADSDGQGVNAHSLATGVPGDITNYAGIYDISQDKAVNGIPATYGSLSDAIGAIDDSKKKGGMTIKYIDSDSEKYVQYRLTNSDFSTDVDDWERELSSNIDVFGNINTINEKAKIKDLVFGFGEINRSTGIATVSNDATYKRLISSAYLCKKGDIFRIPIGYKYGFFFYHVEGSTVVYDSNSYDIVGDWITGPEYVVENDSIVVPVVAKKDYTQYFSVQDIDSFNNSGVKLISWERCDIDYLFDVGSICNINHYQIGCGDDELWNSNIITSVLLTRFRTIKPIIMHKDSYIKIADGYRYFMFTQINGVWNAANSWATGNIEFSDETTIRLVIDVESSTKVLYTQWPPIEDVVQIYNDEKIIGVDKRIEAKYEIIVEALEEIEEKSGEKKLYLPIGELVNAHLQETRIDYNAELAPYRLTMKDVIGLPFGDRTKITVHLGSNYVMGIRFGSEPQHLKDNMFWYFDGDEVEVPDGSNFYRVSICNINGGAPSYRYPISPLENTGIKLEAQDNQSNIIQSNEEPEKILSTAMLYCNPNNAEKSVINRYAVLAHTSDCHGDYERVKRFFDFSDAINVDAACVTGDIVPFDATHGIGWFHELVKSHNSLAAICCGNHDVGNTNIVYGETWNDEKVYNFMFADIATKIGNDTQKTWYYKDIAKKKLRIISVNLYQYGGNKRWYTHFTNEQLTWIVNTLASTPANYGVVILSHAAQVNTNNAANSSYAEFFQSERFVTDVNALLHKDIDGEPLYDIVDAFISKGIVSKDYTQSGSPSTCHVECDFTNINEGVEFIAHLTGHIHEDSICYVPNTTQLQLNLNVVCTTALYGDSTYPWFANIQDIGRNLNDASQDAFNVYVIDRDAKKVKVIRIGNNLTYQMRERKYMEIPYKTT